MDEHLDKVTRGKTSRGRLRALDDFVCRYEADLLDDHEGSPPTVVDLGLGEEPWTTIEMTRALRGCAPGTIRIVGVEIDPRRAAHAAEVAGERFEVVHGGFDAARRLERPVRLVRAMNVLREYPPGDARRLYSLMGRALATGGVLLAGSCDRDGARLGAHLMRRVEGDPSPRREALLWYTDFSRGFAPWMMRDWLPRDLRRAVSPSTDIYDFFADWHEAWEIARDRGAQRPRRAFADAWRGLAARRPGVVCDDWLLERGYALWRPPGGVPLPGQ
jgi:hypothetical protein